MPLNTKLAFGSKPKPMSYTITQPKPTRVPRKRLSGQTQNDTETKDRGPDGEEEKDTDDPNPLDSTEDVGET